MFKYFEYEIHLQKLHFPATMLVYQNVNLGCVLGGSSQLGYVVNNNHLQAMKFGDLEGEQHNPILRGQQRSPWFF